MYCFSVSVLPWSTWCSRIWLKKSFGARVQIVFSWVWRGVGSCRRAVRWLSCLCPTGAAARVLLPHTLLMLTQKCQLWPKYHCACHTSAWKCHMQLLSSSLSSVAKFFYFYFFFNLHQEPRNLHRLTQFLALVLKAEVQGCTGQITSAGRYCAAVYFGSTDAIYSCVQHSGVTSSQELNLGLV